MGWRRGSEESSYTLFAGTATSSDAGLRFERTDGQRLESPCFERPPLSAEMGPSGACFIGGGRFIDGPAGKHLPFYSLCQAASRNSVDWDAGVSLLEPDPAIGEIGFGRPVLMDGRREPRLLISHRTVDGYRQMESGWPLPPQRDAALRVLLEPEPESWDAEMTCFGAPLAVDGRELLFYNGNAVDRTGFGLAFHTPLRRRRPLGARRVSR